MTGIALTRALILTYALLSAALYTALLPLWEGFDELYHYGYVQFLSNTGAFPRIGNARLSRELWTSIDFTPLSHFIQPFVGRPSMSFHEYFRLPEEDRIARRAHLEAIDRALQQQPSPRDNYEVKQSPLTYLLLAPFDYLFAAAPLTVRVLALRLLLAIPAITLLWVGTRGLSRRLGLEGPMEAAALFVIFSCQMIYGVTCHIANDALLLPWLVFFLAAVIDSCESPTLKATALTAVLMAIGLLIKASLLFLIPMVLIAPALVVFRNRSQMKWAIELSVFAAGILAGLAGPWYARNIILYHNFTATLDTTAGIGAQDLLRAAFALPWRESIATTVYSAVWTGNSSFSTFSGKTLDVVLGLLVIAAALYCLRARRSIPELVTLAGLALYSGGLIVMAVSFFLATQGITVAPMPWYMQVLLAPSITLCFLGLARWPRWGRCVALATVLLWAYVAAVSWIAKLVPMYAGFEEPHAHLRQVSAWYVDRSAQRDSILSTLCPAPLWILYALLTGVLVAMVATCFSLSRNLARSRTSAASIEKFKTN